MASKSQSHRIASGNISIKNVNNDMTTKTKYFLQKICYKKTASIDMTKYGFVKYASAMHPINLLIKPLKEQLQKIFGNKKTSSTRSSRKTSVPSEHIIMRGKKLKENTKSKSNSKIKPVQKRKVRIVSAKKTIRSSQALRK